MIRILVMAVMISCSGCASMLMGTTQNIPINTNPSGATCIIDGVGEFQTPTMVNLKRGVNYRITFGKEGYEPQTIVLSNSVNLAGLANILWGISPR
jgi:hypothetical protein